MGNANYYSGFYGTGMSKQEAEQTKRDVEMLNAKVGARGREVEVKQNSNGSYYVEERRVVRK